AALNKALRGLEVGWDGLTPPDALGDGGATASNDNAIPINGGATASNDNAMPINGGTTTSNDNAMPNVGAKHATHASPSPPGERAPRPAWSPTDLARPLPSRLRAVARALAAGADTAAVAGASGYDPWFVDELRAMIDVERDVAAYTLDALPVDVLRAAKAIGVSDARIARLCAREHLAPSEDDVRALRHAIGVVPRFRRVDTCAAEFEAFTPYLYSVYPIADGPCEADPSEKRKVMILGGGPNRIGQGIEFDYCCVHASKALSDLGFETIMVNCNPETVSTDYDTSDRLYFEPLTVEDVLAICDVEKPAGVLVQFGGQTPLNLARRLEAAGVPIWGTSPETIDLAEDRERFGAMLADLDIPQPEHGMARSLEQARIVAERIGYPVLVRPSYVLGGRGMGIVYAPEELERFLGVAVAAADGRPILIDRYVEDAYEIDVDALCDGERVVIGGVMQHIEEAGVHSGDSAMVLPPYRVSSYHLSVIAEYTEQIGLKLGVKGLMNLQFAVKDDVVFVLEVNPRCSRTVPFIAKATGVPLARIAAEIAAGRTLAQIGLVESPAVDGFFVKEVVLPFDKLVGAAVELGPEMRSTGEVMGHASHFGHAFAKASQAAGMALPTGGTVLVTVNDDDKPAAGKIARDLHRMGFDLMATAGTADWLERLGLPVERVNKVSDGSPHVADAVAAGRVALVISTPLGPTAYADGQAIRQTAIAHKVPLLTTLSAAVACVAGIRALRDRDISVRGLQEHYRIQVGRAGTGRRGW
ncbi:MAG: carbamoyl-phosphate synthase large subunit, partial [Ardenticatenales bacterium]